MAEEPKKEKAPEKTPEKPKEKAPDVDVRGFLERCASDIKTLEKFSAVARQYGRYVSVQAGKVRHDIPNDQLPYMVALVK